MKDEDKKYEIEGPYKVIRQCVFDMQQKGINIDFSCEFKAKIDEEIIAFEFDNFHKKMLKDPEYAKAYEEFLEEEICKDGYED